MGESNALTTVGRTAMFAIFVAELKALFFDMRWLFLLSAVLILVDFWWGVNRAIRKKKEKQESGQALTDDDQIRLSRMIRRTLVKSVDYLGVVLVGAILGQAIGEPFGINHINVAALCMVIACGCELDSIYNNYCECKGLKKRISLGKFVRVLFLSDKAKEAFKEAEIKEEEK